MSAPMGCAQAVRRLWDLLGGGLSDGDQRALEAHLAWCLRCCGELAFARELRVFLQERARPELPPEVEQRLDRFVDQLPDTGGPGS